MKDVLIIAHFVRGTLEGRFEYLANRLVDEGYSVELVTTDFAHELKRTRQKGDIQTNKFKFNLTILHEPGYHKNVTLKRFYSHFVMGKNIKKYLINRKIPDVIYCAVPTLDVASVAAKYAKFQNVRFIIDVQDLWPEAFKMVFKMPIISDLIFHPMLKKANFIYSMADEVIAVSNTYVNRALKVNNKCTTGHDIFLGVDLAHFDRLVNENKISYKPKEEIWVAYIGTLGHSYDLISVIDALKSLKDNGISNIKLVVMGEGPLRTRFEEHSKCQCIYAEFTGRLGYAEMVGILSSCDIAVNPIKAGSAGSIINKVGDYSSAGLPILNTQESKEYRELVEDNKIGINCINGSSEDLANNLLKLYYDPDLRRYMGENSRRLAEEKFDRGQTYKKIIEIIRKG